MKLLTKERSLCHNFDRLTLLGWDQELRPFFCWGYRSIEEKSIDRQLIDDFRVLEGFSSNTLQKYEISDIFLPSIKKGSMTFSAPRPSCPV